MNKIILMGRLTKEPELKFIANTGNAVAKFTLAVPRAFKKDETDFINCTAFGKQAETIANYVTKGQRLLIEGALQIGSYTNKEGAKVYTTDVILNSFNFIEKATGGATTGATGGDDMLGLQEVAPEDEGDLPF